MGWFTAVAMVAGACGTVGGLMACRTNRATPMSVRALLGIVLCLVARQGLYGQGAPSRLMLGARVRVWAQERQYIGTLTGISDDFVWLTSGGPVVLARHTVRRVDVSTGKRGHFWVGLGSGTLVGLGAGLAVSSSCDCGGSIERGVAGAGIWLGGTVAGAVIGALWKSERWTQVPDWSAVPAARPRRVGHPNLAVREWPSSRDEWATGQKAGP